MGDACPLLPVGSLYTLGMADQLFPSFLDPELFVIVQDLL